MRKLLFLILFPIIAYSQSGTPRVRVDTLISFTPASFVRMNDSLQLAKFIEADSTAFPVAPSFGKGRLVFRGDAGIFWWDGNSRWRLDTNYTGTFALKTYVDSIANLKVDTIYRTSGKDSIQYTLGGRYHAIRDSVGNAIRRVLESDGTPSVAGVDSLQFNSTNFSLTNPSGSRVAVNTIQDIATTSSPTFANVNTGGYVGLSDNQLSFAGGNLTFNGFSTGGDVYFIGMQSIQPYQMFHLGISGVLEGLADVALGQVLTSQGITSSPQWSASPTLTGLTLSGLTLGSVPFIGTGGAFRQNNAKFFWDSTNVRLGVGTNTPAATFEAVFDSNTVGGVNPRGIVSSAFDTTDHSAHFVARKAQGTHDVPLITKSGPTSTIGGYTSMAYDGTQWVRSGYLAWKAATIAAGNVNSIAWLSTARNSTENVVAIWDTLGRMGLNTNPTFHTIGSYTTTSNYSGTPSFCFTSKDLNTTTSTKAQAEDTSSFNFNFSANTGKPYISLVGTKGNKLFTLDTLGGIISGDYPTSDATLLGLLRRGFFSVRDTTHVGGTQVAELGAISFSGTAASTNAGLRFLTAGGTVSAPSATKAGHAGFISLLGHDGTNFVTASKAIITLEATGTWSTTSTPTKITFGTTPTGSTTRATRMVIDTLGALTLNSVVRGSDSFTTTATEDTVAIAGAGTGDFYWIQITGTAAPSANDLCRVEATATGFIVHRAASGTSGLTYNWLRIK